MAPFEELQRLEKLYLHKNPLVKIQTLGTVSAVEQEYPIVGVNIGPDDVSLPTLGVFAGVHGLEKIGTHVVLHFLEVLVEQLKWDRELQKRFEKMRLVSVPMVNPYGVFHNQRSNLNGVDLMRNAPVRADQSAPFLLSGQKISPKLPWYMGNSSEMETETRILVQFVKENLFGSQFSMSLDIHSGFGLRDRLWYPYAKTAEPFPSLETALKMKGHLDSSFPNHVYSIEPQSQSYLTHGDVWDYLYDLHYEEFEEEKKYLPWCLEMGSWLWVKKNPLQLFSVLGPFNPIQPHRYKRILRRHYVLLDFFLRSTLNYKGWI